ncbi:unnamed protein product [Arabidopsis arenosa]|uniref:Peroxidase n=1 Tax=Arabidopsis arenosa TaxID=38785 RepID=A0A8S1ZH75_ARAAE|nr:unnamed protein product [Arabidopsis arenosa]
MRAITTSFFIFCFLVPSILAQLRHRFYDATCPLAEEFVAQVVSKHMEFSGNITAALLRMQYQDCFVNGCDASLLIDSTSERPSEKSARQNANLRFFEIIDEIKKVVESACPKTVSCADILALATRESIRYAGVQGFQVRTGRRDGLRSNPSDVNLPGPTSSMRFVINEFIAKGMTVEDMVALIGGGHSVGVAHCSAFQDRLKDPAMDPTLKAKLNKTCSGPNDPSVYMDPRTPSHVDNGIYSQIINQKGILRIDQDMGRNVNTLLTVPQIKAEMEKTLQWLVPVATNTTKSPNQKTIQLSSGSHNPSLGSPLLTTEDQEMLRDVSKRRKTPGISKSQEFETVAKTRLCKHHRLSKSSSHSPMMGEMMKNKKDTFSTRRPSSVPIIDFDIDRMKALDVIDRVDTIRSL